MPTPTDTSYTSSELEDIRRILERRYAGVFTDDALASHLLNHVGFPVADWAVGSLEVCGQWGPGTRILDIGAGFGSFVARARQRGWDAVGLEIDAKDVDMGRRRLARLFPDIDPVRLLVQGDGRTLPFADGSVQVVTLWNVLEHVPDIAPLFAEVRRVLYPGGTVYLVCPNYAANRLEAHYHLPMEGLVPREEMVRRLREAGRDPSFFVESIFYRTNQEILNLLPGIGFSLYDFHNLRRMDRCLATWWSRLRGQKGFAEFHDPRKEAILLAARREH